MQILKCLSGLVIVIFSIDISICVQWIIFCSELLLFQTDEPLWCNSYNS